MIPLFEPAWGEHLLMFLYQWMHTSQLLVVIITLLADVFVFLYPLFLVSVYIYAIIQKKIQHKISALFIFLGTLFTVISNIFVQFFVDKQRPNIVLGLVDDKSETLLHKFLPSSSFPSDHSALSMGFAVACLLIGLKYKKPLFIWGGVFFILCSIVMGIARVTVAVHWPTDVIAGFVLGAIVPLVLFQKPIYRILDRYMIQPLLRIEKKIFKTK